MQEAAAKAAEEEVMGIDLGVRPDRLRARGVQRRPAGWIDNQGQPRAVRWNAGLGVDAEPFEVTYTTTGKKRMKTRNVVGVLCPTVLAQRMGLAAPIFVNFGDVTIDWTAPHTPGYAAMFEGPV